MTGRTDRWSDAADRLRGAPPEAVLRWAAKTFPGDVAMSSSFQTQSVPLLHMVSRVAPSIPILFLDTGYHFPETLAFRDRLADAFGLDVVVLRGDKAAEHQESTGTEPLHRTDPDRCCFLNKVKPMQEAMQRYGAWISGVRRDQTAQRAGFAVVEPFGHDKVRVHPLLEWTKADVRRYAVEHDLPEHPLTAEGYASIGCAPCTAVPTDGDDRSGRWAGREKTECGLHVDPRPEGAPSTDQNIATRDRT